MSGATQLLHTSQEAGSRMLDYEAARPSEVLAAMPSLIYLGHAPKPLPLEAIRISVASIGTPGLRVKVLANGQPLLRDTAVLAQDSVYYRTEAILPARRTVEHGARLEVEIEHVPTNAWKGLHVAFILDGSRPPVPPFPIEFSWDGDVLTFDLE